MVTSLMSVRTAFVSWKCDEGIALELLFKENSNFFVEMKRLGRAVLG